MAFIQKLIDMGIFLKVETPGFLPRVWVTPLFYELDIDTKNKFINVVYAYYITQNPKADIVKLYDSKSGKKVGEYAALYGGLKME